jgi:hypothetical protein
VNETSGRESVATPASQYLKFFAETAEEAERWASIASSPANLRP